MPTDAPGKKLSLDRLQARLCRRACRLIELFQALAPPGEPDRAKHRLLRRSNDVTHCQIYGKQSGERPTVAQWNVSQRQAQIGT
jgi:hypothetical protein